VQRKEIVIEKDDPEHRPTDILDESGNPLPDLTDNYGKHVYVIVCVYVHV
jgi:hypothetical protein